MSLDWPILSTLIWLPIAAGVLLLLLGDERAGFGRCLGWPAARLRNGQVLPVHVPRLGRDAGRADLPVSQGWQLRDRRPAGAAARPARASADLCRVSAGPVSYTHLTLPTSDLV